MNRPPFITFGLVASLLALAACGEIGPRAAVSGGPTSGAQRSQVEIIDGAQFTATWTDTSSTVIRLSYDSAVPVSDVRVVEIAESLTGCQVADALVTPELIGATAAVRFPALCGVASSPAVPGAEV